MENNKLLYVSLEILVLFPIQKQFRGRLVWPFVTYVQDPPIPLKEFSGFAHVIQIGWYLLHRRTVGAKISLRKPSPAGILKVWMYMKT